MSIYEFVIFVIFCLIFCGSGIFVAYQLFFGLSKTGLSDKKPWGANIQLFYGLTSLGIGILSALAIWILFAKYSYYQKDLVNEVVFLCEAGALALSCLVSGQILMAVDLGRPFRALKILTGKKLISPLTLDFLSLTMLTVLGFVFAFGIFMRIPVIMELCAWASLVISVFAMVIHVLLFIPRVGAGYNSEPFHGLISVGCALWGGSAILVAMWPYPNENSFFKTIFILFAVIVFIAALGSILSDILAGNKPHHFLFFFLTFLVLSVVVAESLLLKELPFMRVFKMGLVIITILIEKFQTVHRIQNKPILPKPYNLFEKKVVYKLTLLEWMNMIFGVATVGVVFYSIKILKYIGEIYGN